MARPALLETFETRETTAPDEKVEITESWQSGFEAGYEKALQDTREEQAQLSAQVVQQLNDLSFGYHEARAHLEGTLRPLFDELVDTFVPHLAREAVVPLAAEELRNMANRLMEAPIQLRVAPGMEPVFRSILSEVDDVPLRLFADSNLHDQQVILTGATEEAAIDLRSLVEEIGSILGAMTTRHAEVLDHG